jgi:hypothetical protein
VLGLARQGRGPHACKRRLGAVARDLHREQLALGRDGLERADASAQLAAAQVAAAGDRHRQYERADERDSR